MSSTAELPKKVKAIVLTTTNSSSDYSNLQVKEEDYPKLDRNDKVIVRIKAVGLNFAELMQRQGLYRPSTKTPYTPGYEGSGVIEEIGAEVTDLNVSDRVVVFGTSGIWKEVVVVPSNLVCKIPDSMSFEEGAGLLVNYLTAYQMLFRMARIQPGDSVLIHMAAGGVGTAATQLCKTLTGVVIFGTASTSKHDAIRENGVDYPIDYTSADYVQEVKKVQPEGVDIVLDPLNGENSIKGYGLLKPLGKIIHFGAASMAGESRSLISAVKTWWKCLSVNSLDIMSDNKMLGGYHLGVLGANPTFIKTINQDLRTLLDLYEQQKIKIKIDSTYSFSKVGEAMKRMHTRQNIGKVILKPDCEFPAPTTPEEVKVTTQTTITTTKTVSKEAQPETLATEATVPTPEAQQNVANQDKQVSSEPSGEAPKPVDIGEVTSTTPEQNGSVPTSN